MTGGVAVSLQTPRKQDSDFWVYHKRKGCLFTLLFVFHLVLLFSWLLLFRNVSCNCNFDKKGNKQKKPVNVCCRYHLIN